MVARVKRVNDVSDFIPNLRLADDRISGDPHIGHIDNAALSNVSNLAGWEVY